MTQTRQSTLEITATGLTLHQQFVLETVAVIAKVDCRVCVISALYETKQATLPRQNNQIHFGFGKNITVFFMSQL